MGGYAWVTLATNDSYSLGALVLAHSLKQVGTQQQLAVLITPGVTNAMRTKLQEVFNVVQEVNLLDSKDETNLRLLKRPELGITFTKLHCWRLVQFDKCVFLDADTLVLENCDELFEREELSAAPDIGWPDCFNSGVFVYRPSNDTYEKLIQFALDKGSFDGGDQGLLNLYFSDWAHKDISKHLPFIYNMASTACYSYLPAFKQFGRNAKIIHFIGYSKPWLQYFDTEKQEVHPSEDLQHLKGLLQHWWNIFCSLIHSNLSAAMAGIAGAFAKLTLGAARTAEQLALDDHLRRQGWEVGNIDYLGRDSFDNIWSKICETLSTGEESSATKAKEPTPPPKEKKPVEQPASVPATEVQTVPATETEKPTAPQAAEPEPVKIDTPVSETATQITATPKPAKEIATPTPAIPTPETSAPTTTPASETPTPTTPAPETPTPITSPAPEIASPAAAPAPETPTPLAIPAAETPTPATETTTPTTAPATETTTPTTAPAPEVPTPTSPPAPETPVPAPTKAETEPPKPEPAKPEPLTETPKSEPAPEAPKSVPEEPKSLPETPKSVPEPPKSDPEPPKPKPALETKPEPEVPKPTEPEIPKRTTEPVQPAPDAAQPVIETAKPAEAPLSQSSQETSAKETSKPVEEPKSAESPLKAASADNAKIESRPKAAVPESAKTEPVAASPVGPVSKSKDASKPSEEKKAKKSKEVPKADVTEASPATTPASPQPKAAKPAPGADASPADTPSPATQESASGPTPPPRKASGEKKKTVTKAKK